MKRRTLKRAFKVTALVLALLMVAMIGMTGCGAKGGDENVKHKIGVILYGKDDAFGAAEYAYINSAAEALDVEIQWALNDYDAESQLASAENLVAAGCEGLLFLPLSDNTVSLISDYCLQNEIWFQMMNRDISDPDIKAACQANPFYVGTSFEANEDACQAMTEMMAAEGRLNYGLGKIAPGSSLAVRNTAYEEAVASVGGKVLADYTSPSDGSTQAYVTYMENFTTSYPEMDGLLMSSATGGGGETVINTLKGLTEPGKIKICTFDTFEGMEQGFADGWITAIAGGIEIQSLFDFVLLFNAVDGTPLSDTFTVLQQKFIYITNTEDCANYAKYISNPEHMIYDAETIRSMAKRYNKDASLQTIYDLMDEYTLESVVSAAQ
ncbi:MAG: hypothetical protein E7420_00115 [Ruminococcaceae bacterium]|nr:hypothetical protein [Oscillospiraceae bacterium]